MWGLRSCLLSAFSINLVFTSELNLFHFALLNIELVDSVDESLQPVELSLETCALYAVGMSISFSRVVRRDPATRLILPAFLRDSDWRLVTVTCEQTTHSASSSRNSRRLALAEASASSCEDLLSITATSESSVVQRAVQTCFPISIVTRTGTAAVISALSGSRPLAGDSVLSVLVFASTHAAISDPVGNVWSEETDNTGRKSCVVINGERMLRIENGTLTTLYCEFGGSEELSIGFYDRKSGSSCSEISRRVDLLVMCASVEDLTQVVSHKVSMSLGQEICRLENLFSRSIVVFEMQERWKFVNISCETTTGQVVAKRRHIDDERMRKIRRHERAFNRRVRRGGRLLRRFGHFTWIKGDVFRSGKVAVSCLALRLDNLSGLSFNQLCRRDVIET